MRTGGGGSKLQLPSPARQLERLSPRIQELERSFETHRARLQLDSTAVDPEQVLVFELAGTVPDFLRAVKHTPGMEWLVESDEIDSYADEDFGKSTAHPDSPFPARLYLIMANRQSIEELQRLWLLYARLAEGQEVKWRRGQTLWRDIFSQLKDVRFWGPEDRLHPALLQDWRQRVQQGIEVVPLQIELWFRHDSTVRLQAENNVAAAVGQAGGELLQRSVIPEIAYHAMLARLPIAAANEILDHRDVALTLADSVMFLTPVGQSFFPLAQVDSVRQAPDVPSALPGGNPRLAILDGLPLSNHVQLSGRLIIDDPDGWTAEYPAFARQHGTAMASIAIRGDLSSPDTPLSTPVYVRPVMRPRNSLLGPAEGIPEDQLHVDLLHRAIRRLYEDSSVEPAAAPSVRIINYSICDRTRPFDRLLSPLARVFDWLASKYNFLPVISAGNCPLDIALPCSVNSFNSLSPQERDKTIIQALWDDSPSRRILAPAEAINAVTVAATHLDASIPTPAQIHLLTTAVFPSPINPLGFGFRRAIKPDVLAPGGRLLYREGLQPNSHVLEPMPDISPPPGISVATPGNTPGQLAATAFTRGTSNSAAAVSGLATRVCEMLERYQYPAPDEYLPVIAKALVVHSARWTDCQDGFAHLPGSKRQVAPRFLGYGEIQPERALLCTDERVTLFRWGILPCDDSDLYSLPLPPALSAQHIHKRLTITLAWLTPVNCQHRAYRRSALSFQPANLQLLAVDRTGVDSHLAGRGTVQHEVFEGARASPYVDGDAIILRVSCRADAGELNDPIRYAIAVTLETAGPQPVPIYDEISVRVRPTIRV